MLTLLFLAAASPSLELSVYQAIGDEMDHGASATKAQNIDQYMDGVPDDYRIVEEDGSITDRKLLREKQLQAWKIILRTKELDNRITGFQLEPGGASATVWTSQRWDRQMLGRDGTSVHNVVTTQNHKERWELRGSRWVNVSIDELGGTVQVDGKPY